MYESSKCWAWSQAGSQVTKWIMNQSHAVCLRVRRIHDIGRQQKRNFLDDINERVIQHYSCTGYLIDYFVKWYRKIPKISPGAYIFQRPFIPVTTLETRVRLGRVTFAKPSGTVTGENLPIAGIYTLFTPQNFAKVLSSIYFGRTVKLRINWKQ